MGSKSEESEAGIRQCCFLRPQASLSVLQTWKLRSVSAEWRVRGLWESRWRGPVGRVVGTVGLRGGVSVWSSNLAWDFL